ncbi:MAG: transcriptional repressor [Deltaproteobacteria bacterium]|nr:transcriptional repressor [Deltaproteobacteria bacterium]MBN2670140.1 transcriptional repressor [Deltaproteobacteria bacterium]
MHRNTKQRAVIAACFSNEVGPLSVNEVHAQAAKQSPSLGIATVYRAMNAFVEEGILAPVVIGGTTRYEPAAKRRHHHFHCRQCNAAFCVEDTPVTTSRLAPKGFTIHEYDLVVSGTCPSCLSENRGEH